MSTTKVTDSVRNVTAVDAAKLTGSIVDARLPATALNSNVDLTALSASNLTSGTLAEARLATLDATKLTGTVADARLGTVSASKLSGVVPTANLGTGTASSSTFLNGAGAYAEAGGGAWNFIGTAANSGSPVIDHFGFTTGITNTYATYVILCSLYGTQSLGSPRIQVTADGGSSYVTSTDYDHSGVIYKASTGSSVQSGGAVIAFWPIMEASTLGTTTSTAMNIEIRITNLCSAVATQFYSSFGGSAASYGCAGFMGGYLDTNTAYNGFKIYPSGGDIMGRVTVYGIAHA